VQISTHTYFRENFLTANGSCTLLNEIIKCQMLKTFEGGTVCREFESEAPAAEEMLDRVICSKEQFSFPTCLESGDGSGTFCN